MADLYEHLFKVILIGDWGVGKSNIILRITQDAFDAESRTTIGVEFSQKVLEFNKKKTIVQIWDTAGQDRYKAITSAYYRAAVAAILVYDVTKRASFENLNSWASEIQMNTTHDVKVMLLANKIDLAGERQVSKEEGKEFAKRKGFLFQEVSALSGEGIHESFLKMVKTVYKSIAHPLMESKRSTSKLSFVDELENEGFLQKIKKGICC